MCVRLSLNTSVLECEPFYFLISKDNFSFASVVKGKEAQRWVPQSIDPPEGLEARKLRVLRDLSI
jgi:hypothetical protein